MNKIIIFTDGSSRGNPGPGGWGTIFVNNDLVRELGGREVHTTNNRMEMMAVISGIKEVPIGVPALIHTDSSYVLKGATEWLRGWKKNSWKTSQKKDVENKDLWEELDKVMSGKTISWELVPGHAGVPGNERCDVIATAYADKDEIKLYSGPLYSYQVSLDVPAISTEKKKSKSKSSSAKAYSYLSLVNGKAARHSTWAECEACAKGKSGAKWKKTTSKENESEILSDWGVKTL